MPAELRSSQQRLRKLREAKPRLEQQAEQRAAQARQERERSGGKHRNHASKKRYQVATEAIEQANPQYNFTDPDSKIMLDGGTDSFVQGYNAQLAVAGGQVIVATDVVSQTNDRGQLAPMVKAAQQELGSSLPVVLADAGYFSLEAFEDQALQQSEVLVSPDARRGLAAKGLERGHPLTTRMRQRLASESGRRLYAARAGLVEPVFAYIQAIRGLRQFLLRGLEAARGEWRLMCLTHNLLKLRRVRQAMA